MIVFFRAKHEAHLDGAGNALEPNVHSCKLFVVLSTHAATRVPRDPADLTNTIALAER